MDVELIFESLNTVCNDVIESELNVQTSSNVCESFVIRVASTALPNMIVKIR